MFLHFFSLREQIKMHHFNDQTDELWAPPVASTNSGCSVRPKAPLSWQPRQRGVVLRDEGVKHLTRCEHLVVFQRLGKCSCHVFLEFGFADCWKKSNKRI